MLDRTLDRLPSAVAAGTVPRRQRRTGRRVFRAVLVLVLVLIVVAVGLIVAVSNGPIEIAFLRDRIDAAIETALGDSYNATVGSAAIDTDPVLGLVVRLRDIDITDTVGQSVAFVPSTLVEIDPLAVFTSRTLIRSVEVDGLRASFAQSGSRIILGNLGTPRPAETVSAPAAGTTPAPAAPGASSEAALSPTGLEFLSNAVEALDRGLADALDLAVDNGFQRLAAYGATIELWEAGAAIYRRFERSDLVVEVERGSRDLRASVSTSGYSGRWTATAERTIAPAGSRSLSLVFSQLTLADLMPVVSGGRSMLPTDIPLFGRATVGLDAEGNLTSATARLDLGAGLISLGGTAQPILLDEGTVQLRWDVPAGVIYIDPSPFYLGTGGATLTGRIAPVPGAERRIGFEVETRDAVIAPRDSSAAPLRVDRIRFAGSVDLDADLITIDTLSLLAPSGSLTVAGSIGLEDGTTPSLALAASISAMPIDMLKQIWPPGLVDDARRWIIDFVEGGRLTGGTVEAEIPAGALADPHVPLTRQMLFVQLDFAGISFEVIPGLPLLSAVDGSAVLAGSTFGVSLDRGRMVVPSGEVIEVRAGAFAIPDTSAVVPLARVELFGEASAVAFGEIADAPPFRALEPYNVPAASLSGAGNATVSATWPLVADATIEDGAWRVELALQDFGSSVPVLGYTVADGNVVIVVDPVELTAAGTAIVDGLPADVDLAFPTIGHGDDTGRQQIRVLLDEAARERLGFSLEGFLGGTLLASLTDLGEGRQHFELDLRSARVVLGPLGWTKGIGVPAEMSFDVVPVPEGYRVEDIVLSGDDFGMTGEAVLDANYGILSATIRDFQLRRDDNLDFTLRKAGSGWAIDVTGEALDVRGLIAEVGQSVEASGEAADLSVNASIDRLIGFNGELIEDAVLSFSSRGGRIDRVELSGTAGGQPIAASYIDPGNGTAALDAVVGDAGALLRFANFYNKVDGGQLRVNAREAGGAPMAGRFELTNFNIVEEPALARLTSGPGRDGSDTASFDHLVFDFSLRGAAIVADDVLLRGGDMGAAMSGTIDMEAGALSITGTYIPAYDINNFFGRIPVIGLIMGGGAEGGLFGVTFRISGPLDAVRLEINPISAIAPGILRKIFEFQE